jgi:hypothetical protein
MGDLVVDGEIGDIIFLAPGVGSYAPEPG